MKTYAVIDETTKKMLRRMQKKLIKKQKFVNTGIPLEEGKCSKDEIKGCGAQSVDEEQTSRPGRDQESNSAVEFLELEVLKGQG